LLLICPDGPLYLVMIVILASFLLSLMWTLLTWLCRHCTCSVAFTYEELERNEQVVLVMDVLLLV